MINLTNSWMTDPTFLAQSAHFFSAIAIGMTVAYFWGKKGCIIATGCFAGIMGIKEFWYDLMFELPKQSFGDSLLDYIFYLIGLSVALSLVLFVKKKT